MPSSPTSITVNLPRLHPSQQVVADDPTRFRVLACGRRWGKTRLGALLCTMTALRGGRAWWVAPSYPISSVGWREIKGLVKQIPGADLREGDRMATLPGGGWVQVRSADNPDSLRGEGLDLAVVDECAFVQEAAWQEALRPSLSDRKGRALFISTPKGHNWFWQAWRRGQEGGENDWRSWQFATADNPFIDQAEVDAAEAGLPERIFIQEYLAEFIDDAGGVFRRVLDAATASEQEAPIPGHTYALGVDWGKSQDWTVLSLIDVTERALARLDRFNRIDYTIQTGRLKALVERFKPGTIIAESNAMGTPLVEQLVRDGLPVTPFLTTNATKAVAIEALALAFERSDIRILPDPVLIGELQGYEVERLPSGLLRYQAPAGMHDDCVMSLALAWQACATPPSAGGWVDRPPVLTMPERTPLFGRRR